MKHRYSFVHSFVSAKGIVKHKKESLGHKHTLRCKKNCVCCAKDHICCSMGVLYAKRGILKARERSYILHYRLQTLHKGSYILHKELYMHYQRFATYGYKWVPSRNVKQLNKAVCISISNFIFCQHANMKSFLIEILIKLIL